MSIPETIYFQDSNITITNTRAVLGSKTYAMANITSVAMGELPADRTAGIIIALVGLVIAACSSISSDNPTAGIIGGVVVLGLGIVLAAIAKPRYVVKIGSASGESNALSANNKEYVQDVVNAVSKAIIERG